MLNSMMNKQKELQNRLGTDFDALTPEERAAFMRNHFVYLDQELQEALYEVPHFKLWKDYSKMTEEEYAAAWGKVKMELVDSFHFFMNMLLCTGMTAEELFTMYMQKNAENHRRQDAGYTHDVSYKEQAVEDVMRDTMFCTVTDGNKVDTSSDFIAILHKSNGDATVTYNTDAVSLGMAVRTLAMYFVEATKNCTDEERAQLNELFEGATPFEAEVTTK